MLFVSPKAIDKRPIDYFLNKPREITRMSSSTASGVYSFHYIESKIILLRVTKEKINEKSITT